MGGEEDHPRIRGEHHRRRPVGAGRARIIPAYAGSTARRAQGLHGQRDHPRIRGEHGGVAWMGFGGTGSSPHTRGARPPALHWGALAGIIPAYAGSTRVEPDQPLVPAGSSPHTRGAPPFRGRWPGSGGIIPAYAGSTFRRLAALARVRDHPRIRGEHLQTLPVEGQLPRIIPAYAGSTGDAIGVCGAGRDHPRIRGEHGPLPAGQAALAGSSPHTRGAPPSWGGSSTPGRIIPAYAGSTSSAPPPQTRRPDHPRIRGEHG